MNDESEKTCQDFSQIEEIEVNPDTGQVSGWCRTLKETGLLKCDGDCDTCWCG